MYNRSLAVSGAVRAVAAARRTAMSHRGFAFSATKRLGLKESSTRMSFYFPFFYLFIYLFFL